jgi:adenosylhomocysteine nucleosidase
MAAMPDEIKTIHDDIDFHDQIAIAKRDFFIGKFGDIECVLVYSGVGKVAASLTASILLAYFQVDEIIFTGLAGAVDERLQRGDIVLANGTYQHDYDCRPLADKQFEIPYTGGQRLFGFKHDSFRHADQAIDIFLNNMVNYVDMHELEKLHVHKPKYYQGIIASGDIFVQDVTKQDNLYPDDFKVLAVEMEGAAVAQICSDYAKPYTLIRIISDKANDEAQTSLLEFSEKLASHYASGMVQEWLKLKA